MLVTTQAFFVGSHTVRICGWIRPEGPKIEKDHSPGRQLISNHVCMDSQDRGVELTKQHDCNVGHPYGSGEDHNYTFHVPNGKARGLHEHVLRGNGR
jgi:hypothetical protein